MSNHSYASSDSYCSSTYRRLNFTDLKSVSNPKSELNPESETNQESSLNTVPETKLKTKLYTTLDSMPYTTLDAKPDTTLDSNPDTTLDSKPETKRYAKATVSYSNFSKNDNSPSNYYKNNVDEYKIAIHLAENIFFKECIITDETLIDDIRFKVSKIYNLKILVHKVSFLNNFDPLIIGNQTKVFNRKQFAYNKFFRNRIQNEYYKLFPECNYVSVIISNNINEPDTLIIQIYNNK